MKNASVCCLLAMAVAMPGWAEFVDVAPGTPLADPGLSFGIAWGDHDGDGDLDLYLTNDGPNKLLRNEGGDAFADATTSPLDDAAFGTSAPWGDYDNDGDLDIYLTNLSRDDSKLLRNEGNGVFVDATSGPLSDPGEAVMGGWGDHDNDGNVDLYLSNSFYDNRLLRNLGGGVFIDVTSPPLDNDGDGTSIAWGDYDNDGDLDIYLCNEDPPSGDRTAGAENGLFRNDGAGVFGA